jgi:hypothetical protein
MRVTERCAKLRRAHITKTGTTAKVIWNMMEKKKGRKKATNRTSPEGCSRIVSATKLPTLWLPLSYLKCGGQRRDRTADAGLFRAALYH